MSLNVNPNRLTNEGNSCTKCGRSTSDVESGIAFLAVGGWLCCPCWREWSEFMGEATQLAWKVWIE